MLTITEALADLKLIDKKVEKKREFISSYLVRQNALVDPLGDSGGSRKVLEQERQAVADLLERKVGIRRAIQKANDTTRLTIEGEERTIAGWLIWRREVAPTEQKFLRDLKTRIDATRQQASQQRFNIVAEGKQPEGLNDVLVNLSERELGRRAEHIETVLATLDGQLSLKNATTQIEV